MSGGCNPVRNLRLPEQVDPGHHKTSCSLPLTAESMSNIKLYLEIILFSLLITESCTTNMSTLPDSTGVTLELLVITDNNAEWQGPIGDTLSAFFGEMVPTLPQPEPMFKLVHLESSAFLQMFQAHHNIFIINIDKTLTKPLIETRKDLWATPQRVIKMSVPSEAVFFTEYDKYKQTFMELFREVEIERTNKKFSAVKQADITEKLITDFHLSLILPAGYRIANETSNFMWIRNETSTTSQGIFIYNEAYTDTNQLKPNRIIQVRDSVVHQYIPGPREGSYMSTEKGIINPEFKTIKLNGYYAIETRGLWETIGDYMGGPFVSYTVVDEKRGRIVTVEGYVYAPGKTKSLLLHQVDAILNTLKLID
jgi:hypothetical protein